MVKRLSHKRNNYLSHSRKINRINLFPPRYGSLKRFKIYYRNTEYRFNLRISYIIIKVSMGKPEKKARFKIKVLEIGPTLILLIIERRNIRTIQE